MSGKKQKDGYDARVCRTWMDALVRAARCQLICVCSVTGVAGMRPTDRQSNQSKSNFYTPPTNQMRNVFVRAFLQLRSDGGERRGGRARAARRALQRGKVRELHNGGGGGGGRMQLTVVGSLLVRPFPFDDAMPHIFSLS